MAERRGGSILASRYVLGEVIGRGGMGEVRAGRDLRLDRDVAIKLLHPEVAALPKARDRFEAEARAAARLSHPNIVIVHDSGDHEGVPFLVMERLPGRTLADELAHGPLPVERVRSLGADVLAALSAAHGAGIVHRDLKPGNVLLAADGRAKVADFGIAKAVDDVDLTTTGVLLGTPAYLSPEQLDGEAATPASDVYALGVLLYEAIAGTKPFAAGSAVALAHAVQSQQPPPLDELRPDVPPELLAAIARAMEKEPDRRFSTAEDMAAALTPRGAATVGTGGPPTQRSSPTQPFGPRTEQASSAIQQRDPLSSAVVTLVRSRRPLVLVLAVLLLSALLLAVVVAGGGSPRSGPSAVAPTTVSTSRPQLPPELDAALKRLEEVVRP